MTGLGKADEVFGVFPRSAARTNVRLLSVAWIN